MNWLTQLSTAQPVAHAVLILASVITLGLILGSVKFRGLGLGAAGVLFVGIAAGQAKLAIDPGVLAFARDFGLILFVYTIGMQVGPGFITSLRRRGLPLNLLAALVVLLGSALTLLLAWWLGLDLAAMVGVFAGATTNTPALGAAQETLRALPSVAAERAGLPALGYAVAYPFGILGIIIAMLLARLVFRVNLTAEATAFRRENLPDEEPLERRSVIVTNANLNGLRLHQIPGRNDLAVVVSRVRYQGETEVTVANATTVLHVGDVLLAVGTRKHLDDFCLIVGRESTEDLMQAPGRVTYRRFVVTNKEVLGKKLRHLALTARFGVTVTRVTRADIEMSAVPELELQFGDMLQVVGTDADIDKVAGVLGNSVQELNHTNLIPVFIGIVLGVVAGLYPLTLANFPVPVRLGLAGGPLLVAIVLSRIGRLGPLVWYMPVNANILLRELGIALFLACAGLKAGEYFLQVLLQGPGVVWMACGAVITLVPLLVAAAIGRWWMKLNYLDLCGLLSGSMTDPPALAFANTLNNSDAPSVAYATVYPFTMLLRILAAQLLLLFWLK